MNAIEIQGLTKRYKDFQLDNVNLTLPEGCILGLAGENGAGKSTTIRCLMGAARPDAGQLRVLGADVNSPAFTKVKQDIAVVLDSVGFPAMLTPRDVGKIMAGVYQNWDMALYDRYLREYDLPEKKKFGDFSRGMKMKLGFAVAMSHQPRLLILDEATSGLDPVVRDEIVEMLYEYTRQPNHSVLLSSHILSDMEKLCDYVAFIHKGKLLLCEEKDELLSRYARVQCTPAQLEELPEGVIVSRKENPYGAEAVLRRCDVPKGWESQRINMEELFVAMVKGGRAHESTAV